MSTASKKKQQLQRPATPTPQNETSVRPGTMSGTMSGTMYSWSWSWTRRKRHQLTIIGSVIVGLLLLIALLPTLIAHTPLMGYFVRRAAKLDGTITFRSASIGWFSSAAVS
ncbi:MAG: hypothetical protein ABSG53_29140, partial [Thermoguttaceae bacterium]